MKKIVLLFLLFYFVVGCSSANITFKKADNYNAIIEKVFIIQVLPKYQKSFTELLNIKLSNYLKKANIESKIFTYNVQDENLSFEENKIEKELKQAIEEFKPLHTLTIQFKSKDSFTYGNIWGGTSSTSKYNAILFDINSGKKVWLADIDIEIGAYASDETAADKLAKELMQSLVKSGLIKSNINLEE
jgi:hypothetical protein